MASRFYVGDLHFGHEKVAEIRGHDSPATHDAEIVERWSDTIHDGDEVFILGDLSGGAREAEETALRILSDLPGLKHLIAGNHDSVASIHRRGWARQARFLEVFASVRDFAKIRVRGQDVMMSHYPYVQWGDGPGRPGARYPQFRLPDLGAPLIHAHTHQPTPQAMSPRLLCVSWDAWRRPTTQGDVDRWVKSLEADW